MQDKSETMFNNDCSVEHDHHQNEHQGSGAGCEIRDFEQKHVFSNLNFGYGANGNCQS